MRAALVSRVPSVCSGGSGRRVSHMDTAKHGYGAYVSKACRAGDPDTHTGCDAPRRTRRAILFPPLVTAAALVVAELVSPHMALASDTRVLTVPGSSSDAFSFPSIAAAVAAIAASGDKSPVLIHLASGVYDERVVFGANLGNVTLAPGPGVDENSVTITHKTVVPYESTIEVVGDGTSVTLRNLRIRHASKSVANNYAVFANAGGVLAMTDCDVSSTTGCGIACEGSDLIVTKCLVHDCKSHGVAVFGDLLGDVGGGKIEKCFITKNGGDGVVVRQGAIGTITECEIVENDGYAVTLIDVRKGTAVKGNTAKWNKRTPFANLGGLTSGDDVEVSGNIF
jgi:hypothetical protein